MSNLLSRGNRVVHRLYGRGRVERLHNEVGHLKVRFDGEPIARRVIAGDCEKEPAAMPVAVAEPMPRPRLVWPVERAGERVSA